MRPELTEWLESGRYFRYKQNDIFVKKGSFRKRPTMLLIHGFPTASFDFYQIWDKLSRKFNLITADMLGFGFSGKPLPHTYSIIEQADILEALLQHEKITDYHILAHDYGVSVAQELLARQHPAKKPVRSICFLNGGLYPEFHKPLLVQKLMLGPLGPLLARFFSRRKLRASFDKIFGTQKASGVEIDCFWQLINYNNGRRVTPQLLRYMIDRRTHRDRWITAMENTRIPIQMINGPLDPISGKHLADAFASRNPKAKVVSLKNVGHYPQTEAPEAVLEAYLPFLRIAAEH
jgi:pimeloyl-ACP methyl ester carboxylesterase